MTIHIAALTCPTLLAIAIIAPGCSSSSPSADTGPDTSDDATADAPADAMPADAAPDAKALPDNPASRYPQIADVRTIGGSPSADYPTFSAAIADLASQAVPAGGVLFRVEPGSYPERFTVPALKGSDAQRPVVFAAALTDADQRVVVRGTGSDASEDAMITLDGCDHVTFDSIDVVDGGSDATDRVERGYYITGSETDGATHNTLRDAAIRLGGGGGPVSPLTKGVFVRGKAPDATATAAACSHNRFDGLRVDRAAEGIVLRGATVGLKAERTVADVGNHVTRCVLGAKEAIGHDDETASIAFAHGISVSNNEAGEISDNVIHAVSVGKAKPMIPAGSSGISARRFSGAIFNNRVLGVRYEGEKGSQVAGIRVTRGEGDRLRIYNNFVSGLSRSAYDAPTSDPTIYVSGIRLFAEGSRALVEVAHNTVVIETPADAAYPTAAFNLAGGSSGKLAVELRDNILINRSQATAPGGASFAVVDGNTDREYLTSDNNLLRVTGPQGAVGVIGRELGGETKVAKDLAAWRATSGQDAASSSKAVTFADVATGDLHLGGASASDGELRGPPIGFVTRDIDGEPRSPTAPSLGADEVLF